MGRFDNWKETLLGDGEPDVGTNDEPDPGAYGYVHNPDGIEYESPPDDALRTYWRQYEYNALVRKAINTYTNDIIEPGYRVRADDDKLEERMNEWLSEAAIVHGESDRDFLYILEEAIKQKEVRGTALVEVVPQRNNLDGIWGFNLINVETVDAVEYEDRAMLFQPDDTEHPSAIMTRRGEAAAYVQYSDESYAGPFTDREEVPLSQNDVVKLTLDGDAYDIFGTSRLESVSTEIKHLNKILEDNRKAIASKGHPHWIFYMGEPSGDADDPRKGVWPDDKIQDIRDEHKQENFSAGQKDFLPGDIEVDVVSGETADIKDTVNHYVEEILAAMPVPKYMVGHADAVNRDITKEQGDAYRKQVKKARRELEASFRPALKRKAEEWGYEDADVELRIEQDTQESPLKNDDFDAQNFKAMAEGIKTLESTGMVSQREVREDILGLEPEPADETEPEGDDSPDDSGADSSESINTGDEDSGDSSDDVDDMEEQASGTQPAPADD